MAIKHLLTLVGRDQVGIVSAVTKVLLDLNCNIEDTSMTQLEDQFAMLFIVSCPPELPEVVLHETLEIALAAFKLHLSIHQPHIHAEQSALKGSPWMISVSGEDYSGIIHHVTHGLASLEANIRQLSTKRLEQARKKPLFLMAIEVDMPSHKSATEIEAQLKHLAQEQHLEIHAEAIEVYTL
jgi:glycine cleavage system transcriptional repressor